VIAVDAHSEAVLGVVAARIWTRTSERKAARQHRALSEKESQRWLDGSAAAATGLGAAAQIIVVMDREGDIYGQFAQRPSQVDVIVRAGQDRTLAQGDKLFEAPLSWPALGRTQVRVAPKRPGDRGRSATLLVRAGTVQIARPGNSNNPADPASVTLTLVEACEQDAPPGAEPLHWRLLSTLAATTLAQASEVIRLYRLRWRIEQVFRALKSDGLALEEVQMQAAERLFKLAAVGLIAAVRTIQLVDARDGSERPASDVIDPALIEAAAAIGRSKEGNTARQKNPHPHGSLAWLAWIIARLGGWNCYYKPPGPKTMREGWNQFAATAAGYILAKGHVP